MNAPFRLAVVATHPIQYLVPVYRDLAARPGLQLTVLYFTDFAQRPALDPGFGVSFGWDVDLLSDYRWQQIPNYAARPSPRFAGSNCPDLRRILSPANFDAVLVPGIKCRGYMQALVAAMRHRISILYRGESGDHEPRSRQRGLLRSLVLRQLYRRITAFLPIGIQTHRHYERLGVPPSRLFRSPYCVDNDRFSGYKHAAAERRERTRHDLGIPPEAVVVCISGKLTSVKRPLDPLLAASAVADDRLWLLYLGEGPLRTELQQLAADLSFHRVVLAGFRNQTEIGDYYAASDCLCLSSLREPWGLVVNEAMLFGLPAITADTVGCAPDLVRDGVTGFIYRSGDRAHLTAAIHRMIANRERMRAMGDAAAQLVRSQYSPRQAGDGIISACASVPRAPGSGV